VCCTWLWGEVLVTTIHCVSEAASVVLWAANDGALDTWQPWGVLLTCEKVPWGGGDPVCSCMAANVVLWAANDNMRSCLAVYCAVSFETSCCSFVQCMLCRCCRIQPLAHYGWLVNATLCGCIINACVFIIYVSKGGHASDALRQAQRQPSACICCFFTSSVVSVTCVLQMTTRV
jgi:hypothetical protein